MASVEKDVRNLVASGRPLNRNESGAISQLFPDRSAYYLCLTAVLFAVSEERKPWTANAQTFARWSFHLADLLYVEWGDACLSLGRVSKLA